MFRMGSMNDDDIPLRTMVSGSRWLQNAKCSYESFFILLKSSKPETKTTSLGERARDMEGESNKSTWLA